MPRLKEITGLTDWVRHPDHTAILQQVNDGHFDRLTECNDWERIHICACSIIQGGVEHVDRDGNNRSWTTDKERFEFMDMCIRTGASMFMEEGGQRNPSKTTFWDLACAWLWMVSPWDVEYTTEE